VEESLEHARLSRHKAQSSPMTQYFHKMHAPLSTCSPSHTKIPPRSPLRPHNTARAYFRWLDPSSQVEIAESTVSASLIGASEIVIDKVRRGGAAHHGTSTIKLLHFSRGRLRRSRKLVTPEMIGRRCGDGAHAFKLRHWELRGEGVRQDDGNGCDARWGCG
jgi:hypothetical protein